MAWLRRVSSRSSPLATGGLDGIPGNHEYAEQRALLDDLKFTDLRVASEQCEVEGVDGDLTAVAGAEGQDVVATAVDGLHPGENASAGAGVRVDSDNVGHLESEQRLDQVVQIGDQQPGAGLTRWHRLPVGVDVLDKCGVPEQVDALVVFALRSEQSFAGAVHVEGGHAKRFLQPQGHLGRAQLRNRDQNPWRHPQPAGVLLVGQPCSRGRISLEIGGLELVERLHYTWERQRDRYDEDAVHADPYGGCLAAWRLMWEGLAAPTKAIRWRGSVGRRPDQAVPRRSPAAIDRQPPVS
jgi:hypothetical protein